MDDIARDLQSTRSNELFVLTVGLSLSYVAARMLVVVLRSEEFASMQVGAPQSVVVAAGTTGAVVFSWVVSGLVAAVLVYALYLELTTTRRTTDWNVPVTGYLATTAVALLADFTTGLPFVVVVVGIYGLHRYRRIGL